MLRTISIWNMRTIVVLPLTISWLLIFAFAIALSVKTSGTLENGVCSWDTPGFYVGALLGEDCRDRSTGRLLTVSALAPHSVAVAIFGLLCLCLTVLKLNRQKWRDVLKGLLPQSKPNLDLEDVSVMLVQRTTAFFFVQFALIILVGILYFVDIRLNYQLMNFVAFKAITSSTAGQLFRKSWKLTRHADNGAYNRPPSYYPGWAEENLDNDAIVSHTPPNSSVLRKRARGVVAAGGDDEKPPYVEGEFHSLPSSAKSILSARTPAQAFAAIHGGSRRGSTKEGDEEIPETVLNMDAAVPPERDAARKDSVQNTPTFVTPAAILNRPRSSVRRGTARSRRSVRPKTDPSHGTSRQDAMLSASEIMELRPVSSFTGKDTRKQDNSGSSSSSPLPGEAVFVDETEQRATQQPLSPTLQVSRDDLNHTPTRSRLWLDSSAERVRMEAAAGGLGNPTLLAAVALRASTCDASASYAPSISSSSRTNTSRPSKRGILENANEAGEMLNQQRWAFAQDDDMLNDTSSTNGASTNSSQTARRPRGGSVGNEDLQSMHVSTSRAAFLPSPAIVPRQTTSSRLDRRNFDFDVIRQSMQALGRPQAWQDAASEANMPSLSVPSSPLRPKSGGGEESANHKTQRQQEKARVSDSLVAEINPVRPKTAPSQSSSESVPLAKETGRSAKQAKEDVDGANPSNALDAFRRVIEDDNSDRRTGVEDASRPRTSRGATLGVFGQLNEPQGADTAGVAEGGSSNDSSTVSGDPVIGLGVLDGMSTDERPNTSHGGPDLKPFGFQGGNSGGLPETGARPVSAIEEQYKRLAAYVREPGAKLQRVESKGTMEDLA